MAAQLPPAVDRDPALHARLEATYAAKGPDYRPRTHLLDGNRARYVNRLIEEASPYLLQHAHNPVDWRPWNTETLDTQPPPSASTVGAWTSLACSPLGTVHVSWAHEGLKHYQKTLDGAWKDETPDPLNSAGFYSSLSVDRTGRVHISYHDDAAKTLRYVAVCPPSL